MLNVMSNVVELRGVANKTTKAGKVFYVLNVESDDGTPHALYCPDFNVIPSGLSKGDKIHVQFDVRYFGQNERLVVSGITKVD